MLKQVKYFFFISSLILLGACTNSLELETTVDVPDPLVRPLPLNMAIYHPEETRDYVYRENTRERRNWSIKTGPSQLALFDQILPTMFTSASTVETLNEAAGRSYDGVIVPKILDIQFALPLETRLDFFEVWIRYDLLVQQPEGETIATLPLTGYGKSPADLFNTNQEGLRMAANQAFRDIGAKLIVGFSKNPDIKEWLVSKSISN